MAFASNRIKLNDAVTIAFDDYKIEFGYDAQNRLSVLLHIGGIGRIVSISPTKIKDLEKLLARHIMNNEPSEIFRFKGGYKIVIKALYQGLVWYFWSRPPLIYYWLEHYANKSFDLCDGIAAFFASQYGRTLKRLCKKTGRNLYGHWIDER
jgi:hypothetical protein